MISKLAQSSIKGNIKNTLCEGVMFLKFEKSVRLGLSSTTCGIRIDIDIDEKTSIPIISYLLFLGTQIIIPKSLWTFANDIENKAFARRLVREPWFI